ncbi:GntR family transcriptional regulator [Paenibacillus filicis]|uniref:GntR family transcriptional regulator n=1 Tax=Paenibacillus gyeongsangnamensis TaxID=3388067 RepID=A0ABT4Q3W6_9BACL|nr:GntR family transcriptional regulator [Paenibacillus filicis]MCZ8511572.1 GntR family transcriptional regulator [Paenibacillus filicis]
MKINEIRTLTDSIYESLRQAILSGDFRSGDRLKELELSKNFNVSSTPIREALARLSQDGLVSIDRYRGATITTYTSKDFEDLYQIREFLEIPAIRIAASKIEISDIKKLQQILEDGDQALEQGDFIRLNNLDLDFHETLVMCSRNQHLSKTTRSIHEKIQTIRRIVVPLSNINSKSQIAHYKIFDAVRNHDADRAESELRCHIQNTAEEVLHLIKN